MVKVKFYFKEGCWLCGAAEEMLNGLKQKFDIEITKIPIDQDEELYEEYRDYIPVIEFKDGSYLHGYIKKKDLIKKLEENQE